MRTGRTAGIAIAAAALAGLAACGRKGPEAPGREVVTQLLQQEADALKRDGEKLDPVLRVKATWTIAGRTVDVIRSKRRISGSAKKASATRMMKSSTLPPA